MYPFPDLLPFHVRESSRDSALNLLPVAQNSNLRLYFLRMISDFSLRALNTFGIEAKTKGYLPIASEADLLHFIQEAAGSVSPLYVLGGGSNLLFTKNWEGIVLHNQIKGKQLVSETDQNAQVLVGGGEVWHEFVMECVGNNWGGVENLSLIPGSVGAAPMQNIGAYGAEIKDTFVYLEGIFLKTGEKRIFYKDECEFGYRESIFKRKIKDFFITKVCFELSKNPVLNTSYGDIQKELEMLPYSNYTVRDVSNAVIAIRSSKLPDPKQIGNAGSFFKNPTIPRLQYESLQAQFPEMPHYPVSAERVKIPAAWLIQTCGWKGKRFGNYGVHEKQALVLVNYGGANGNDIFQLSESILQSVFQTFGIQLEREVNVL